MKRFLTTAALGGVLASVLTAQNYPPPPTYSPQQLEQIIGRIALYPDPLLAQVLTASTYWDQIPDADGWARAHAYLSGDQLARDIADDNLPWDPGVQALLPFPGVLDTMAGDMNWAQQLGSAVLADRGRVMDAIQDARQRAYTYGYLRSTSQYRVVLPVPGEIQILPVDPNIIYVPYYDPYLVFYRPPPGIMLGAAITFGPRIFVGSFLPWGWLNVGFVWRNHGIIINNRPWERSWGNRGYVHPYQLPVRPRPPEGPRTERHELRPYQPPGSGPGRGPDARPAPEARPAPGRGPDNRGPGAQAPPARSGEGRGNAGRPGGRDGGGSRGADNRGGDRKGGDGRGR